MKGISLFSGAGIGETYLAESGIDIVAANEIIPKRAELYRKIYSFDRMILGDIRDEKIFNAVMEQGKGAEFLIASPPCQGMSVAGKNRNQVTMGQDNRNYFIMSVVKAIEVIRPDFVLIENVPALLKIKLEYLETKRTVLEILKNKFDNEYNIEADIVDTSDYGVPQTRLRAIIKMYKKDYSWKWPKKTDKKITVESAIGDLPSLEAGETSDIKWHYARKHDARNIQWMQHTPTGHSAFENEVYFPQKEDGTRIKGYMSCYRRIKWDEPAPTITIRNDCIGSQRNVHPGRLLENGIYSDARVLTPLELMILTSLPKNWNVPDDTPEILIRQCIGEAIPPLLIKKMVGEIQHD